MIKTNTHEVERIYVFLDFMGVCICPNNMGVCICPNNMGVCICPNNMGVCFEYIKLLFILEHLLVKFRIEIVEIPAVQLILCLL